MIDIALLLRAMSYNVIRAAERDLQTEIDKALAKIYALIDRNSKLKHGVKSYLIPNT